MTDEVFDALRSDKETLSTVTAETVLGGTSTGVLSVS